MQTPIRTIVPGLLLAFSATAVHASPKAAEQALATGPATGQPPAPTATTQPSSRLDLTLPPDAATPAVPTDLSLPPPAATPATPTDLSLPPDAATPAVPTDLSLPPAAATPATPTDLSLPPAVASPAAPIDPLQGASAEVKEVVRWINNSSDNSRLPFLLIDKVNARVFAFNPAGQLQGDAPVLLGMGVGDRMLAPSAAMSQMPPHTRITPAGRFVSKLAKDSYGKELLVLDYAASFSLHPVVNTPGQRRPQRLASATVEDNRISFGCINVPAPFYKKFVNPAFASTHGIVYILPETSPASAMFRFTSVGALVSGPQKATPAVNGAAAPTAPAATAN